MVAGAVVERGDLPAFVADDPVDVFDGEANLQRQMKCEEPMLGRLCGVREASRGQIRFSAFARLWCNRLGAVRTAMLPIKSVAIS